MMTARRPGCCRSGGLGIWLRTHPCVCVCVCVCERARACTHVGLGGRDFEVQPVGLDHTERGHRFVFQAPRARAGSVAPQGHKPSGKRSKEVLTQSRLIFLEPPTLPGSRGRTLPQPGPAADGQSLAPSPQLGGPVCDSDRESSLRILSAIITNRIRESTNTGSFTFPSWTGPYK